MKLSESDSVKSSGLESFSANVEPI